MRHKYYRPEEKSGICVVKRRGEKDEDLIRRFKKKFSKSGISKEVREKMYYEKPSDKKRRKLAQSLRAIKREEEKAERLKKKAAKKRKQKARRKKKNDSSRSR
ncbi:MAG: 30S ribosomal protein S21 [Candidatus Thorarchaeota archaeon]